MGMIAMITVLVMDVTRNTSPTLRNLNKGQLELREDAGQDLLLVLVEITAGLLFDDLEVVNEHPCGVEIHLGFSG